MRSGGIAGKAHLAILHSWLTTSRTLLCSNGLQRTTGSSKCEGWDVGGMNRELRLKNRWRPELGEDKLRAERHQLLAADALPDILSPFQGFDLPNMVNSDLYSISWCIFK